MRKILICAMIILSCLFTTQAFATVSSSTARVQYNCNGSLTEFDFTFGIINTSDIDVIIIDTDDVETLLTETTHYSLSATNNEYSSGGTVTTVATYDSTYIITILRAIPKTQESDYTEGMPTLYETFEESLDKLTRITQDLASADTRTLSYPDSTPSRISAVLPNPLAGALLGWNSSEDGLVNKTDLTAYSVSNFAETLLDDTSSREIIETLNFNIFLIDANVTDQGAATAEGDRSIKDWVDSIGSSEKATLVLTHNGIADTTEYILTTSETISSNIKLKIENGAILDGAGTLPLDSPNQITAKPNQQIFGSSITISFTNGGTVYPELWGIDGTSDEVQFQAANDAFPSDGGTVELAADTTYVVSAPNTITLAGGTKYYAVKPKSNVTWKGNGYNTVVQLAANQTASSHDPGVFVSNAAYENVTFENFRIDLNGANNAIGSNLNTPAIWVSGDSAYAKNIKIDGMWFENCPGLNFVILGQSNSTGATLGDNLIISNSKFYQGALDTNVTDHSSIYTWADNVRITDNLFENLAANVTAWKYSCAWEFHGSNNIAKGNTVKRYARGCYTGSNYVSASEKQIVDGNNFELVTRGGVVFSQAGADIKALSDVIISNNNIELYDYISDIGGAVGVEIIHGASASVDLSSVSVLGNTFSKSGGTIATTRAVALQPQNSRVLNGFKFQGNTVDGVYQGVYIDTTSGEIKTADINGNTFQNLTDSDETAPVGITTQGAGGLARLKIHNNHFVEDNGTNKFDHGILLSGTLTNLDVAGNTYEGMVSNNYIESSLTYTTKKLNGNWTLEVAAAATGGTDTFIVTITLDNTVARTGFIADLIGNFAAAENIYKQFAFTGYMNTDVIADAESAEVITIGDALKSALTAGNPAAVGSANQISITFTSTDDTAFEGVLSLSGITDVIEQILSVTVANNQ